MQLVIHILSGIAGIEMNLDGSVGGLHRHLFLDDHTVLNVLAAGVDLLTIDEAVQLGILGNAPDISRQQHMGNAKVLQTFPPLLTDVTIHMGDLKGLLKEVGADISLPLEIGGDLRHGCQGANPAAILPVTPGGMVLAVTGNLHLPDDDGAP